MKVQNLKIISFCGITLGILLFLLVLLSTLRESLPTESSLICLFISVDVHNLEDNGAGRVESSAEGQVSTSEADRTQEPNEGMTFESEEAARAYYDEYAGMTGFITRVLSSRKSERDGSIISRGLGCRGIPDNQRPVSLVNQKRDRRRDGCTAMILVKREKPGTWVVRKFVRDHNHPLVIPPSKRRPTSVSFLSLTFVSTFN